MNRICAAYVLAATLAVAGLLISASAQNTQSKKQQGTAQQPTRMLVAEAKAPEYPIPSLQGPSWLKHLGLTVSQTRMGQVGGTVPISGKSNGLNPIIQRFLSTFRSSRENASEILNEKFLVSGSDLYRWNCQGCHGPDGKGATPEINSVLGPVQGTSPR